MDAKRKCTYISGHEQTGEFIRKEFEDTPDVRDAAQRADLRAAGLGDCDWGEMTESEIEESIACCPKHLDLLQHAFGGEADGNLN